MPRHFEFYRRPKNASNRWGYKTVPPLFTRETVHTIYLGRRYAFSWVTGPGDRRPDLFA